MSWKRAATIAAYIIIAVAAIGAVFAIREAGVMHVWWEFWYGGGAE